MTLAGARFFHVNVNCVDLVRSCRFYTEGLGLEAGVRTTVDHPQPGEAFGLERARWDAWILVGPDGFDGGAIDLLEWQEPRPAGSAPTSLREVGFQRLGVTVPDLDAALARVRATGGSVLSAPFGHALDGGGEIRLVVVRDPDGTPIELVEGGPPAVSFVAIVCDDLAVSLAFYERLGFDVAARFPSANPDGTHLGIEGPVAIDEVVLRDPRRSDVVLMLVGFRAPATVPAPARTANALGMWRAAFVVPDADQAFAAVTGSGITPMSPPVTMAMGAGLPALRFFCFRGPDAEVVEVIEQPSS